MKLFTIAAGVVLSLFSVSGIIHVITENAKLDKEVNELREQSKASIEAAEETADILYQQQQELLILQKAVDRELLRQLKVQEVHQIIKECINTLPNDKYYTNSRRLNSNQVDKIATYIVDYSEQYDVPLHLAIALIKQESAFNVQATSRVGARGLTQLMPATAETVARQLGITHYDITNPRDNVRFGIFYLSTLLDMYKDQPNQYKLAVNAYNMGPGRAFKTLPLETQEHEHYIFRYASQFQARGL